MQLPGQLDCQSNKLKTQNKPTLKNIPPGFLTIY